MTGHGQATARHENIAIVAEVRTVNNRFLKVVTKVSERVAALEPHVENLVREHVKRGSVNVSIRVDQIGRNNAAKINLATLEGYLDQIQTLAKRSHVQTACDIGSLLNLPGALENSQPVDDEALLAESRRTLQAALLDLQQMRSQEGSSMSKQFAVYLAQIEALRSEIALRAPEIVAEYRNRLDQKVRSGLASLGHPVADIDILREVLIFADRCDISEEVTRLGSHVVQFEMAIQNEDSQGRKLDFLIQEFLRETNTIGSKANDSRVSQWVVAIKTIIEQMRELVQNVE
jgi:uncharacterized protein (TIGR00255 family)